MTDTLTPEARSALMARIVGRNTGPELAVRRLLHAMGYRFRADRQCIVSQTARRMPDAG